MSLIPCGPDGAQSRQGAAITSSEMKTRLYLGHSVLSPWFVCAFLFKVNVFWYMLSLLRAALLLACKWLLFGFPVILNHSINLLFLRWNFIHLLIIACNQSYSSRRLQYGRIITSSFKWTVCVVGWRKPLENYTFGTAKFVFTVSFWTEHRLWFRSLRSMKFLQFSVRYFSY